MTVEAHPACAIVITTINRPTAAVQAIAGGAERLGASVILVGDDKSPPDFHQPGATYLDLQAQSRLGLALAGKAPTRHYARKNFSYLEAVHRGAQVIVETDDDNFPLESFWQPRVRLVAAPVLREAGWVNAYRYFTERPVWPRGLPLDQVRSPQPALPPAGEAVACPIQQGLAAGDPDVDAVWRLVFDSHQIDFASGRSVALAAGSWCPFNSQNTSWWPEAFPLLYLPSFCSFRMTDIWRSFVAQRIVGANDWGVLFTSPTVRQERNQHDLMRDFADEVPGYLYNTVIRRELEQVNICPGVEHIPANIIRCYQRLTALEVVGAAELELLGLWFDDLTRVS